MAHNASQLAPVPREGPRDTESGIKRASEEYNSAVNERDTPTVCTNMTSSSECLYCKSIVDNALDSLLLWVNTCGGAGLFEQTARGELTENQRFGNDRIVAIHVHIIVGRSFRYTTR